MARDSLRATLDELKVDPSSAQDRPYLEAMLRRLGYTEKEIREELGPVAEAEPVTLAKDAVAPGDVLAPAREYRLVVPARESSFAFDNDFRGPASDAPFEDFERVEFQETGPGDDTVEFEEVATVEPEELSFVEETPPEPAPALETSEFQEAETQEFKVDEQAAGVQDVDIDTFGGPDVGTQPKTRVRVKRVRAKSKAEAEAKVASGNRRVIKSIPVDIVERWGAGPDDTRPQGSKKKGADK